MAPQYDRSTGRRATLGSLQSAGMSPATMRRLKFLRWRVDACRIKPATPHGSEPDLDEAWFEAHERAQLRFLKWRFARGEFAESREGID